MSKGSGGGGRGGKGGGGGGGGALTQASLDAARIEGASPRAIASAWKEQFGTEIKSAKEIHSLIGIKKADLGGGGAVSVSTAYGQLRVTAGGPGISIGRTFSGGAVKHDNLYIAEHMQGKGLGTRILKTSVEEYQRLGVKKISLTAAEGGRYVWPKMGFRVSKESLGKYSSAYRAYAKEKGLPTPGKIRSVQQIARSPGGKEFLTSRSAPNLQSMSIRTKRLAQELAKR